MNLRADVKHQVMYYCKELWSEPQAREPAPTAQFIGLTQKTMGSLNQNPNPEVRNREAGHTTHARPCKLRCY